MMNMSDMLTSLKMDLGIYAISLPFENADEAITQVIHLRSLKTFSQFFPFVHKEDIKLSSLKQFEGHYNHSAYQIPDEIAGLRVVEIRDVNQKNKLAGSGYLNPIFDASIDMYHDIAMAQVSSNLMSIAMPSMTWDFVRPNRLHLHNISTISNELNIEFGLEHSKNLGTISPTAWESFYELALLDVKRFLYNSMKHYNELQTAYGTIMLRIDDWSNAESERKDLITRWRQVHHLDKPQVYII